MIQTASLLAAAEAPTMSQIAVLADQQIIHAVRSLWPSSPMQIASHVPSTTCYIRRLHLGNTVVYAKVSLLGMPLAHVLRGAGGSWPDVSDAQHAYAAARGSQAERQAAQLAVLTAERSPPRVSDLRNQPSASPPCPALKVPTIRSPGTRERQSPPQYQPRPDRKQCPR